MSSPSQHFLEQHFKLLTLEVDHHDLILSWHGNLENYGLDDHDLYGHDVTDYLPCLIALSKGIDTSLPYMNLPNDHIADIHVQWEENGYRVTLVDTSTQHTNQQQCQQLANNVTLLNEKLRELSQRLQEKNQQLDIANRAKSDFISGLSHEFRTPIASIIGHANWLKTHRPENSGFNTHLETIQRSSDYLLALIENLLQQGSIEANKLALNPTSVDLKKSLTSTINMVIPLATEKGIALLCHIEFEENALFKVDENSLQQAILNLLTNAIKFTDHGEVKLTAHTHDQKIFITIKDTGIGIAADELSNISSSFTRGRNATHRPGLGLGLSITNGIIEAMRGEMELSSTLGEGTSVTLQFPAIHADTQKSSSSSLANSTQGTVMLLDDNVDITNLYKLYFHEAGIGLRTYQSPEALLRDIHNVHPALILTDYHLGETNGLSFVQELREQGHEYQVFLLTATLSVNRELHMRALEAGCDGCWQKSTDVTVLINRVKEQLDRSKQTT